MQQGSWLCLQTERTWSRPRSGEFALEQRSMYDLFLMCRSLCHYCYETHGVAQKVADLETMGEKEITISKYYTRIPVYVNNFIGLRNLAIILACT